MVFAVISVLLALVITVAAVIAIVMSTSQGTDWIQSLWSATDKEERGRDQSRPPGGTG